MLEQFAYIARPEPAGEPLAARVRELLLANGRPRTCEHVFAVAEEARRLAERFGENQGIAEAAALLHDISAVVRPADMLMLMEARGAYIDEAERAHPFLLHQRVSRIVAAEDFGVEDARVLAAIEVHTTLKRDYAPDDLIVYLADKLAWDQPGEPPYAEAVCSALEVSLEAAALRHIDYAFAHGMILKPHRWLLEAREALQKNTARKPA